MKLILEYKVFDLLKNPENEKFLSKVKKENPDLYVRFLNILGNKGLEAAKQKYNFYDPEVKKAREDAEKSEKLRRKQLGRKKLREIYDEGLLLKYKNEIDEIEDILFNTYFIPLASKIEKDPRISKYLKSFKAKKWYKNIFKDFIKKPINLRYGFAHNLNLDILAFVINRYNVFKEEVEKTSIIKIIRSYDVKTKELYYTVNFKLYDELSNSYFLSKLNKEKDIQFLIQRNEYIKSLNQSNLSEEELNDIIFNKFSNILDENSYNEWKIKQMTNKYNL